MLTVLAENKNNREIRSVIDLPAQDGTIKDLYKELGAESDRDINIRYAGTGELWSTDTLLLENNLNGNPTTVQELNLFAYLLERMTPGEIGEYDNAMSEYVNDLGTAGVKSLINEAYETINGEETEMWYNGENLTELVDYERTLLKPYPEMNKNVFWKMVDSAKAGSGDDYEKMGRKITQELSMMSPQDIILYKDINDHYVQLANREGVYESGSELQHPGERSGLSDDGFTDYRCWLIGQGKDVYMNAMSNPDSVLTAGLAPYDGYYSWECFNYIASNAYTQNTGEDLYNQERIITQEQKDEIESEIEYGTENQNVMESELDEVMRECGQNMGM